MLLFNKLITILIINVNCKSHSRCLPSLKHFPINLCNSILYSLHLSSFSLLCLLLFPPLSSFLLLSSPLSSSIYHSPSLSSSHPPPLTSSALHYHPFPSCHPLSPITISFLLLSSSLLFTPNHFFYLPFSLPPFPILNFWIFIINTLSVKTKTDLRSYLSI